MLINIWINLWSAESITVRLKTLSLRKSYKRWRVVLLLLPQRRKGKNKSNKNLLMLIDGVENEDDIGRKRMSLERGLCQGAGLAFLMCWRASVALAKHIIIVKSVYRYWTHRRYILAFLKTSILFNLHWKSLL